MADVKDLFYHGVRHQIGRVLNAMGEDRVRMGLTAFDDGAKNWSACFFARAYPELLLHSCGDPELAVSKKLGMGDNKVPMRIVYRTFDGLSSSISREQMQAFMQSFLERQTMAEVEPEVLELLRSIDYSNVETDEVVYGNAC